MEEKSGLPAHDQYPPPSQDVGYPQQLQGVGYPPPQPGYTDVNPPYSATAPMPPQDIQSTAAYPQGYGQPPPYYPGSVSVPQDQQQGQVTVFMQQPVATTTVQPRNPYAGAATAGIALGAVLSVGLFFCGCWWALPCSIIGMVLGITASSAGDSGDLETAKKQSYASLGCSAFALLFTVAALVTLVIIVII